MNYQTTLLEWLRDRAEQLCGAQLDVTAHLVTGSALHVPGCSSVGQHAFFHSDRVNVVCSCVAETLTGVDDWESTEPVLRRICAQWCALDEIAGDPDITLKGAFPSFRAMAIRQAAETHRQVTPAQEQIIDGETSICRALLDELDQRWEQAFSEHPHHAEEFERDILRCAVRDALTDEAGKRIFRNPDIANVSGNSLVGFDLLNALHDWMSDPACDLQDCDGLLAVWARPKYATSREAAGTVATDVLGGFAAEAGQLARKRDAVAAYIPEHSVDFRGVLSAAQRIVARHFLQARGKRFALLEMPEIVFGWLSRVFSGDMLGRGSETTGMRLIAHRETGSLTQEQYQTALTLWEDAQAHAGESPYLEPGQALEAAQALCT